MSNFSLTPEEAVVIDAALAIVCDPANEQEEAVVAVAERLRVRLRPLFVFGADR